MKTNQKRLISIILVIVFIFMAIASGEGEPVDTTKKVPQSIAQLASGEKIPFSEEMLSNYNFSYEVSDNQKKIMLYADTKGFAPADYIRCKIKVVFSATVIFENMAERNLSHTFEVNLPFSGSSEETIVLDKEKFKIEEKIHAIYNASFEVLSFSGELIKK